MYVCLYFYACVENYSDKYCTWHGGSYETPHFKKATVFTDEIYESEINNVVYNIKEIWKHKNRCLMLLYHSTEDICDDGKYQTYLLINDYKFNNQSFIDSVLLFRKYH